ncbi:Ergosterol biosynthesis ERG4/ERG24 [Trinorchestia longiramus]|nr:Ergosterol biosynthesis ERG4/ERG24 [Trinorchestia longiramus]
MAPSPFSSSSAGGSCCVLSNTLLLCVSAGFVNWRSDQLYHNKAFSLRLMLYDIVRYHVGPPLMVVGVTVGIQVLAVLGGKGLTCDWSLVGSSEAWCVVGVLAFWALLSLWVPGKEFIGPVPQFGRAPRYRDNGYKFYWYSVILCFLILMFRPGLASRIYYIFPEILAACNITALVFCVYLLIRGKVSPQTAEKLPPRPLVYEFYRGMEMHPRWLGVDVKQLTVCRFGMMAWQLLVIIFLVAGSSKNGLTFGKLVCAFLQSVYIGKFFWWETGYFDTIDIRYDRAGYYICWGCIVFVPGLYTFTSYFLVARPPVISGSGAFLCLILGLISIALNYRVDWEKQYFRQNKGKCFLWGRQAKFIKATYVTPNQEKRTSLLLTSGCWGMCRHLNYVFELLLALSWSLIGVGRGLGPFLYFFFLTILLVHRVFRDEEKCKAKYGQYWDEYCKVVPYRLIPGMKIMSQDLGAAVGRSLVVWCVIASAAAAEDKMELHEDCVSCGTVGMCVPLSSLCDGSWDCPTGEDEDRQFCDVSIKTSKLF